jgi:putative membrane protein
MNEKTETSINKDLILRERLAIQRTKMANQTTLLSFVRTALYFLIAGLSIRSLLQLEHSVIFEISFFIVSFGLFVTGILNYLRQKKLIDESEKHVGDYKIEYMN